MAKGRKTGGRTKGTLNKATATIKEIAGKYTEESVGILIGIARESESDAARVSAVNSILDRAYGKPSQVIAGDEDRPLKQIMEVFWKKPKSSK